MNSDSSIARLRKWGALASLVMVAASVISALVYLSGNLRDALGPLAYALADFLYGPVWAASLVAVMLALKAHIGERAPRRMKLALLIALAAASAVVAVAAIRSANRHYHLLHPDLHLEDSTTVLIVWATLVAGAIGTAWHLLGWAWVLVGASGWTTGGLPRGLSALYLAAGVASLFVYLLPDLEGAAMTLGLVVSVWQGILLWKAKPSGSGRP